MLFFARLFAVAAVIAALSACTSHSVSTMPYTGAQVRHIQDSGGGIPDTAATPLGGIPLPTPTP